MVPVRPEIIKLREPHLSRHTKARRKDRAFLHKPLVPFARHWLEHHLIDLAEGPEQSRSRPSENIISSSNLNH